MYYVIEEARNNDDFRAVIKNEDELSNYEKQVLQDGGLDFKDDYDIEVHSFEKLVDAMKKVKMITG